MKKVSEIKISYSCSNRSKVLVKNSQEVWNVAISHWDLNIIEYQEEMKLVLLNRANEVLGIYNLSKGGTTSTIIDIKIILAIALKCNANAIVIIHNHPSGNLKPSEADKKLTGKLRAVCKLVDLKLLDHLIINRDSYYSFADSGIL